MERTIDTAGRIVIPMEYRRLLQIEKGEHVDIRLEGDQIILSKAADQCMFCKGKRSLLSFQGGWVCQDCQTKLVAIYNALLEG